MSFRLVKALRSSQQLAWIALSYNCDQLLVVNIFRDSRCGIKFRSTCWGKGKTGLSAPSLRSLWKVKLEKETLDTKGPGAWIWPATPAAVPPLTQLLLLLKHLQSSLSTLSQSQQPLNLFYSLLATWEPHEFTVFQFMSCFCCQKSLCETTEICDVCLRWSVWSRSRLNKQIHFSQCILCQSSVPCHSV